MTDPFVLPSGGVPSPTPSSLLVRVRGHDPSAWARFVRLYGPVVFGWCLRAGLQPADAQDVGQEVFRAVVGAIGAFIHHREGGSFRAWLRTITLNKIRDFSRKVRQLPECPGSQDVTLVRDESVDTTPEDVPTDDRNTLMRRAVELVLADVSEETRSAFLRAVGGDKPADIARDLGVSVNVVYLARSRIARRIREEFDGLLE